MRLRSLPVQEDAGMPRRAAISSGRVDDSRDGSANAFVVFQSAAAAEAALAHNMREVRALHLACILTARSRTDFHALGGCHVLAVFLCSDLRLVHICTSSGSGAQN